MSSPIFETIEVSQVIARCKMQLRLRDNSQDNFLNVLICEALDSLNVASQLSKQCCELTFCDGVAELPKGVVKFLALKLPCDTTDVQTSFIYADTDYLKDYCDTANMNSYYEFYQIKNGYIHLYKDLGIETAMCAFLGLNVDKNGNTVIYRRYERALWNYACSVYATAYSEDYNQYLIDKWDRTWVAQKNFIAGQDRMREFELDKIEISALMLTRLITPAIYLR